MMVTCGECAQWAFMCLSAAAAAGGGVLLAVGVTALARDDWRLVQLLDTALCPAVGAVLIVVGGLVAVLAALAVRAARREEPRLLRLFFWATLALLVAAGVAMVVGFAVGAQTALEDVRGGLQRSIRRYTFDEDVRAQWDALQADSQCCGVDGAADWPPLLGYGRVPSSCCPPVVGRCTVYSGSYRVGCVEHVSRAVETYSAVVGGVCAAEAVLLLVAMVASYALIKASEGTIRYTALTCPSGSF